jgi:predicted PurR-regulated permease PerM
MPSLEVATRTVVRTVLIVITAVLTLYVLYLLRKPISWLIIAAFIAVAAAGPVNALQRWMKRGFAIVLVYLSIVLIPIGLGALLIPPLVNQVGNLASNAPSYVQDVKNYVDKNETLRNINQKYDITDKLEEEAGKLAAGKLGDAAGVLRDIGFRLVSSIFAGVTIFILSIFMVAAGPRWLHRFIEMQRPEHAERIERTLRRIANAVGNYVGGALLQATIAALTSFVVLTLLGVPFAGPLAVVIFVFDLIPVVGATIAAFLAALVTVVVDFPLTTIIWVVFAIVYQQVENYLIQPQIQRRATEIEAFVVLVAVLFGSTLFGIIGALLAIPTAASIQIAIHEYSLYRADLRAEEEREAKGGGPGPEGGSKPGSGPNPRPNPTTS